MFPSIMVGSTVGFAPPAIGCIATVLVRWIKSEELWTHAEAWNRGDRARRGALLGQAVIRTLVGTPVPPLLYRTAMPGATIDGHAIEPGSLAIVGLGSAALDDAPEKSLDWLFGGDRATNPHACPARGAAMAVVVGAISAVLERQNLEDGGGLLLIFGEPRT